MPVLTDTEDQNWGLTKPRSVSKKGFLFIYLLLIYNVVVYFFLLYFTLQYCIGFAIHQGFLEITLFRKSY